MPIMCGDMGKMVEWYQWNNKRVERPDFGDAKLVTMTVKDREKDIIESLTKNSTRN